MPATAALAAAPLPEPGRRNGRPASAIADHEAPLIRRAQAGDRDAFGELYRRHEARVRRHLASKLRGREADVDDLVAETFLVALQRISTFQLDRPGAFGNWLVGIARNKRMGWRARASNQEAALDEHSDERADSDLVSPEQVALDRLEVARALSRLAPRVRRALVLQHAVGLPCAEVALALGTTKRSIWALTSRARSELSAQVSSRATAIRPERLGRVRHASTRRERPPIAPRAPLCACGCGAALPAVRAHNRRYATTTCRSRAAWRRRQEAQRRYLAGPVSADPAVERVLAVVRAAGGEGTTRSELSRRTRLLAARLDRALDLLARRRLISVVLEPSAGRLVMRHRALTGGAARRAA